MLRWPRPGRVCGVFAIVGAIVYFSAYFQQVQGRSPIDAGLDVAAIGVAYALAATASGRLVGRIGERAPLIAGLIIGRAAMLGLLRLQPGTGIGAIWWNFALLGLGIGLCGTPMSTIAMSAVDTARAGMASAVLNALHQVGQVFGVAVLGALVYADLPAGSAGQRLDTARAALFITGLHQALWVSGLALFASALTVAALLTRCISVRQQKGTNHEPRRSWSWAAPAGSDVNCKPGSRTQQGPALRPDQGPELEAAS